MSFSIAGISMRAPEWGDSRSADTNDIRRYTRMGLAIPVFSSGNWVTFKKYRYSLTLANDILDSLHVALLTNHGKPVTLVDEHGTHTVFIMAPVEIIAVRPPCSYSVNLEALEVVKT